MKKVTLVSLYGEKHGDLKVLIQECQEMIMESKLGKVFNPYEIEQVHGTIIGMEKHEDHNELFNKNIYDKSGVKLEMHYEVLLDVIEQYLPLTIRFGGFGKNDEPFLSNGKRPYIRSFQVQWDSSRFTLIGWPHEDGKYCDRKLWGLREALERKCNIKHKYSDDNDLFMVLGQIECVDQERDQLADCETRSLEKKVREYLSGNKRDIEITDERLFIVQYEKETLSLDCTTRPYCIHSYKCSRKGEFNEFVRKLYE